MNTATGTWFINEHSTVFVACTGAIESKSARHFVTSPCGLRSWIGD